MGNNNIGLKGEIMAPKTVADSGFQRDYTDPGSGMNIPTAWIQIRQINYVPSTYCLIVTDVYLDEAAYLAGKSAIFYNIMKPVKYEDADWMTYFDVSVMTQAGHDIQAQSLLYLENTIPVG